MNKFKYYIEYFDKEFAQAAWQRECSREPMSYQEWLSSGGYSDCWSIHRVSDDVHDHAIDSEKKAANLIRKIFGNTDATIRRMIITGDRDNDWETDYTFDNPFFNSGVMV